MSRPIDQEINIDDIPPGTGMIVEKTGEYTSKITMPKKKLLVSDIFPFIFCLLWLSFVCYWTYCAALVSVILAIFSIPFWVIGIIMFGGILTSIQESQILEINNSEFKIIKVQPIKSIVFSFTYSDIHTFKIGNLRISNPFILAAYLRYMKNFSLNGLETPLLITGSKTVPFFETANEIEKEWIVKHLNKILSQIMLTNCIKVL